MSEVQEYPTCRAACPVHTDTRAYVDLVAQGRYHEAFDLIRAVNPFPSVCGYICHHPCEQECRRKHVDSAVALRELKRFVAERSREYRRTHRAKAGRRTDKSVAVIGAGPGGLTTARQLAIDGHAVTVFDRNATPGGVLAHTIPAYRLPDDVLDQDIEEILSLGIEFKGGTDCGRDGLFTKLVKEHDAVVLATGLPKSAMLPGLEGDGIEPAMEFLQAARCGKGKFPGDRCVVIGGGNVAMDVARTARRLGATHVDVVCLENEEEIPAWPWELEETVDEGIQVHHRWGPVSPLRKDGKIVGLKARKVTSVFDGEGRFAPKYDDSVTKEFPADSILVSIGQRSDLDFVKGVLELDARGRLVVDRETGRTSRENVFACGEVVTGPGAAIEAVASGQRVAKVVAHYLETGEIPEIQEESFKTLGDLSQKVLGPWSARSARARGWRTPSRG
ncbi:MAG: FAD-dependent oxidoreductase [Planctomycetota bacterium]